MFNWSFETLIITPFSVQQADPFFSAEMASLFLIAVWAPRISLAASLVNSTSR